jgi:hypothetical protein
LACQGEDTAKEGRSNYENSGGEKETDYELAAEWDLDFPDQREGNREDTGNHPGNVNIGEWRE